MNKVKNIRWGTRFKGDKSPIQSTTADGRVFHQAPSKLMGWCVRNRESLLCTATEQEQYVFHHLSKLMKRHAIQQYPFFIDGHTYFADIYVKKHQIIIEVDGEYHSSEQRQLHDRQRDKLMASIGIRVYRISNAEVDDKENFKRFKSTLCKLLPPKATHRILEEERQYLSNVYDIEEMIKEYGYIKVNIQSLFKLKYNK